jgi:hypothetical protein
MKGIVHDRLSKRWIVSEAWGVFFGFSGAVTIICIIIGVIDAIL